MSGTNQWGPYYDNTGISFENPYLAQIPGVNSPVNTNVPETVPQPPAGGINPYPYAR